MSKGSWQRPGSGYASGYDRIFGKSANDSAGAEIVARGSFRGADGHPDGWIFRNTDKERYPIAMELRLDGSVYIFGKLDEAATADRRAVMLAASDAACNSALQAEPAGQLNAGHAAPAVKHPIQPLVYGEHGRVRFKKNTIVDFLANGRLNELASMDFPQEDWEQLAQLIGYSLSGFGTLSYVTDETYDRAAEQEPVSLPQDQTNTPVPRVGGHDEQDILCAT